jgi:hypothetical protein
LGACGLLSLLTTAYSDAYIDRDTWVLDVDMHSDFEFACVRTTLDQAFGPSQVRLEGNEAVLIGMRPDAGARSEWIYVSREPGGRLELDGTVDDAGARADEWTAKMSPSSTRYRPTARRARWLGRRGAVHTKRTTGATFRAASNDERAMPSSLRLLRSGRAAKLTSTQSANDSSRRDVEILVPRRVRYRSASVQWQTRARRGSSSRDPRTAQSVAIRNALPPTLRRCL